MAFSFYGTTVGTYLQINSSLQGVLSKGRKHCEEAGVSLADLVSARVHPTMLPFSYQVESVVNHSLGALEAMRTGVFPASAPKEYDYAGLEALIRAKPVHTYGTPAYAGWGLTNDWAEQPGRDRQLNLHQLAAIMLGRYPRYFNWSNGQFCDALSCLRHLQAINSQTIQESFYSRRLANKQRRIRLVRRLKMAAVRRVAPIGHWLERAPQVGLW
jgi:hypothetical protein